MARVVIGMSGGVDSSVAALLLKEQGYDPLGFRFMCLNSHYRKQLVFTYEALDQNEDTYNKLKTRISNIVDDNNYNEDDFNKYNDKFKEAISNDLNTANALTVLDDVLKDTEVSNSTKLKLVESFDKVLSLDLIKKVEVDKELEEKVNKLIEERNNYKANKDYENAYRIRGEIESLGVTIKDTREGTIIIWE